jgi:hypothetical protein
VREDALRHLLVIGEAVRVEGVVAACSETGLGRPSLACYLPSRCGSQARRGEVTDGSRRSAQSSRCGSAHPQGRRS